MADLASIIANKSRSDEEWKAQRQAEREDTIAMREAAVTEITSQPELYAKYLDMQGDNPTYSAGNIAVVMFQNPSVTTFATPERWRQLGRRVNRDEQGNALKIFVRSKFGKSYNIGDAYDISQTSGRELTPKVLENNSPEMEKALTTLLNYSVVPVETTDDLEHKAYYDDLTMRLYVHTDIPDNVAFAAIATEVALSRIHAKGINADYDRDSYLLDAQSVSYILCKRFGVQPEKPDLSGLGKLYEGWNADARWHALSHIQEMSKQIGGAIEYNIAPPQRARAAVRANVR